MNYITIWEFGWGKKAEKEERTWSEAYRQKKRGMRQIGKFKTRSTLSWLNLKILLMCENDVSTLRFSGCFLKN